MKEAFDKLLLTIDSIEDLNHVDTCQTMVRQFQQTYLQEGHNYAFVLLGYLQATVKHKLS